MSNFSKAVSLLRYADLPGRTLHPRQVEAIVTALQSAGLLAPDAEGEVERIETWVGKPIYATCCGKCENECYVDYMTGERE